MKQKELAAKLGTLPLTVGRLRKKVCTDEEYNPKTKELTPKGVGKIVAAFDKEVKEREEREGKKEISVEPEFVQFKVTGLCPNPLFVWGQVYEPYKTAKVRCSIPQQFVGRINSGSKFRAQETERKGVKHYRHEKCLKR